MEETYIKWPEWQKIYVKIDMYTYMYMYKNRQKYV